MLVARGREAAFERGVRDAQVYRTREEIQRIFGMELVCGMVVYLPRQ